MTEAHYENLLAEGLNHLDLSLSTKQKTLLLNYLELLQTWNKTFNLTALHSIEKMIPKHLLESLWLKTFLVGDHILDIGTGAGLPGLPLAIAEPNRHFVLLDSNGKKTRFLQHVCQELQLQNVSIEKTRLEDYRPVLWPTTITTRAMTQLPDLLSLANRFLLKKSLLLVLTTVEKKSIPELYHYSHYKNRIPGIFKKSELFLIRQSSY